MSSTLADCGEKKNSLINRKKPLTEPNWMWANICLNWCWGEQRKMGMKGEMGGKDGREEREIDGRGRRGVERGEIERGERDQEHFCTIMFQL